MSRRWPSSWRHWYASTLAALAWSAGRSRSRSDRCTWGCDFSRCSRPSHSSSWCFVEWTSPRCGTLTWRWPSRSACWSWRCSSCLCRIGRRLGIGCCSVRGRPSFASFLLLWRRSWDYCGKGQGYSPKQYLSTRSPQSYRRCILLCSGHRRKALELLVYIPLWQDKTTLQVYLQTIN